MQRSTEPDGPMMRKLRAFLLLSPTDRRLLVDAAVLLGAIKVGFHLLPFRTLRHLLACVTQVTARRHKASYASPDRVGWAVTVASQYLPGSKTCLIEAMAAQVLLKQRGFPASLCIGLAKGAGGQLEGHAWIESQEKIVIGALDDLSRYTPLPPL